jgi:hypothetical protein
MNLELNDAQAEVLTRELHSIIQNDRYPFSPRIVALKEIMGRAPAASPYHPHRRSTRRQPRADGAPAAAR